MEYYRGKKSPEDVENILLKTPQVFLEHFCSREQVTVASSS